MPGETFAEASHRRPIQLMLTRPSRATSQAAAGQLSAADLMHLPRGVAGTLWGQLP